MPSLPISSTHSAGAQFSVRIFPSLRVEQNLVDRLRLRDFAQRLQPLIGDYAARAKAVRSGFEMTRRRKYKDGLLPPASQRLRWMRPRTWRGAALSRQGLPQRHPALFITSRSALELARLVRDPARQSYLDATICAGSAGRLPLTIN